jgi:hypothetical protein
MIQPSTYTKLHKLAGTEATGVVAESAAAAAVEETFKVSSSWAGMMPIIVEYEAAAAKK